MNFQNKNNEERILIICLQGIGDNIMFTPTIRALRKKNPRAFIIIDVFNICNISSIWRNNPFIDEVYESEMNSDQGILF